MQRRNARRIARLLLALAALAALTGCRSTPAEDVMHVMEFALFGSPTPTRTPGPTPTPAPPAVLTFSEDPAHPLPAQAARLKLGEAYPFSGIVTSNYPLTRVFVSFTCYRNYGLDYPKTASVRFHGYDRVMEYDVTSDSTIEGTSLAAQIDFSAFTPGLHTMTLSAASTGTTAPETLAAVDFYVLGDTWERVKKADFSGTYGALSKFFGGKTERFLYPFQWVYDRYVVADPDWEAEYIVSLDAYGGRPWLIHTDAKPYYEKALSYIAATRIRVHGTNGDSGVLPLSQCILTYNGSYVPRYTSSLKTVSHHAFGTATDINAKLVPNDNRPENRALIDQEVNDFLVYNGILLDENGNSYYDFTYSGAYAATAHFVPDTIINYLLYEFAFYRAGFQWGHYYNSTSDAMHFSLTDNIKRDHSGKTGLRKVWEYDH